MRRAEESDGGLQYGRRRLLVGGTAAAAGMWVAPAVLSLDRVAAATGTCGAAPLQVDWSDYSPSNPAPSSVTANDGTVVTLSTSDPFGVAGSRHFTTRTELYGGVQGFLASEMVGGNNGDTSRSRSPSPSPCSCVSRCWTSIVVSTVGRTR